MTVLKHVVKIFEKKMYFSTFPSPVIVLVKYFVLVTSVFLVNFSKNSCVSSKFVS